jgi:uncharacterized linocin/CFP29 family protein
MNHLLRELAPVTDSGWRLLDDEAKQRLTPALAARRLVDFTGPHGWQHSSTNLGRTTPLDESPTAGVRGRLRRVLPLAEVYADFSLGFEELQDVDRGADDTDLTALDDAAHELAVAENTLVFHGWAGVSQGITQQSPHDPIALGEAPERYPASVAQAVERLLNAGVGGPYGIALGDEPYRVVVQSAEHGGYPLAEHLGAILGGPIVWAPGVNGAVVVSQRGGDFVLDCGQDVAIGYRSHDAETVSFYLQESLSFHVATPEAAVVLTS